MIFGDVKCKPIEEEEEEEKTIEMRRRRENNKIVEEGIGKKKMKRELKNSRREIIKLWRRRREIEMKRETGK